MSIKTKEFKNVGDAAKYICELLNSSAECNFSVLKLDNAVTIEVTCI